MELTLPCLDATTESIQSYKTCESDEVSSAYQSLPSPERRGDDPWRISPGDIVAYGSTYSRSKTVPGSKCRSLDARSLDAGDRVHATYRLNQARSTPRFRVSPPRVDPVQLMNSTSNNSAVPLPRCQFDTTEDISIIQTNNSDFTNNYSQNSKDRDMKSMLKGDPSSDNIHNVPYVVVTGNTMSMEYSNDAISGENKLTYISKKKALSPLVIRKLHDHIEDNENPMGQLVPSRLLTPSPFDKQPDMDEYIFEEYNRETVVLPRNLKSNLSQLHLESRQYADRYTTRLKVTSYNEFDSEGTMAPPSSPAVNQINNLILTPNCRITFKTGSSYRDQSPNVSMRSAKASPIKASEVAKRIETKLLKEKENCRKTESPNSPRIPQLTQNNGRVVKAKRKILTYIGPLDTTFSRRVMRYSQRVITLGSPSLPRPDPIVIMRATMGPIVAAQMQAEQRNQIIGKPRHFAIAIVMLTYMFLGMAAVLPGQILMDIKYFMKFDMIKALLMVSGREIGIVFGALMVGGAFRGHRWFLAYSSAAMLAAICFFSSNFIKNFKALSALFAGIGVTTAFLETATNVITLRMAHRRRLTLNYHQLAYALGSVSLIFLADLYVRPDAKIFYYESIFVGYKMMFYYAAVVFTFVAALALIFWFFVERSQIENINQSHFLKNREYSPWTKLESFTAMFFFAQVGHQRIYEWLLYSYVLHARKGNLADITIIVALYHVLRAAYFLIEVFATALRFPRTWILLPFTLIGCFSSSLCMFLYMESRPEVIYACVCIQGFSSAAMGPSAMVWFSKWHESYLAGTRSRFWGGAFGSIILPFTTVYLMREGGQYACRSFQTVSLACVLLQFVVCLILVINGFKLAKSARRRTASRQTPVETEYWEIFTCFR